MFKKLSKYKKYFKGLLDEVEYDLEPYYTLVEQIRQINLKHLADNKLKALAGELKLVTRRELMRDNLLVTAFALAREVSRRVLGQEPFDVQLLAGIALHRGKVVEMATGEGKTLAAVMPAYLNALTGRGVHIHTFNDYLAQRDARWMGPIFDYLGLRCAYIQEGMDTWERQRAYLADITYVTAKEAGFDLLRDFLCCEKEQLIQRPFHYAIVDEADSILIDEARTPLVIAGAEAEERKESFSLSGVIQGLLPEHGYQTDQNGRNVYFTEEGISWLEETLGCGSLFEPRNLQLLNRLNSALYAEVLLIRDRDYIVREGKIELIDEFTGRVADKRQWPDYIQAAVEEKEGLAAAARGRILGSIALQHFLKLYPRLGGMTGTAKTAAGELRELYGLDVVVIPPNKPCLRKDNPDRIFAGKQAKDEAFLEAVRKEHKRGRPILIGTQSVEESEKVAADLKSAGMACQILNAKNDEMESRIIARAGEPGAITVSTNMAGRGVDIRLGGEEEQERERVVSLGGLLILGTGLQESRRLMDQLRGRAGRQGDPGESTFFVSMEDDLIQRYGLAELPHLKEFAQSREGGAGDAAVGRELERGLRSIERYNSELRRQLWRYAYIIEQQRLIIHKRRQDVLTDKVELNSRLEKQITLCKISKMWADYLAYIAYVREGIHLVVIGNKNPLDEFHKLAIAAFDDLLKNLDAEIARTFQGAQVTEKGLDLEKEGLKLPSATWTYLIRDDADQFSNLRNLIKTKIKIS